MEGEGDVVSKTYDRYDMYCTSNSLADSPSFPCCASVLGPASVVRAKIPLERHDEQIDDAELSLLRRTQAKR